VEPGREYEGLRQYVIESLQELRDPETGHQPVSRVYRREEVYSGPYLENAPDMVIEQAPGYYVIGALERAMFLSPYPQRPRTGGHRPHGIFLAYGPDIRPGARLDQLSIYDVAPTVLHLMGLPIPGGMDGRVMQGVFFPHSEPARREPIHEDEHRAGLRERIGVLKRQGRI